MAKSLPAKVYPDKQDAFGRPLKMWPCDSCDQEFNTAQKRNGHQRACREMKKGRHPLAHIQKKREETEYIEFVVNPSVSINGRVFAGRCRLPKALGYAVMRIMEQAKRQRGKETQGKDHGMANYGFISGK